MKSATLLILILLGPFSFAFAQEGYHLFKPGTWEARLGTEYRYSDANYDSGGGQTGLVNGGSFQLINFDFSSRYTLNSSWAAFGRLSMGNAESNGKDAVRSGTALTGAQVGVEWNLGLFEFVDVIPQASFFLPFEKVSRDQDSVMTSEGVDEILLNLHMQTAFEGFRLYGALGYMLRGEGRSHLLPWRVGMEWPFRTFLIGARLMGYESMSDDKDAGSTTGEIDRLATVDRVSAGSFKFYSVNPGVVDSDVYMAFALSPAFHLGFQGGLTLTGSNSASEYHAGASLTYRFTPAPIRTSRPAVNNDDRLSIDPYVDQFREDTRDGVDQDLFRPKPKPRQQPPRRPLPARPPVDREAEEMKKLQQQLDDAEMTIELKVDPKQKKRRGK
ncbi:MAG: hypothetical protein KF789_08645 [Bdellovibrionaceae bacterium]|nr:hypothetical protein [Pseudobdellovibrionaceae bacterium]